MTMGPPDPLVALARADPLSPFYDPRYARPLSSTPPDGWGEIDMALLEETRAAVPAFPVDLLPTFWRDWVLDTANATGAPADYVAQSLFAAVAGLCGAGVVVRLGPRWDEPLVLWQALVGPPSSGKSPAMAPMRELLGRLDAERDDDAKGALVTEASLSAVADAVTANPRGVVLWRDDPPTWLHTDAVRAPWLPAWSAQTVSFGQGKGQRRIDRFAISLLLACQPHHLADLLAEDREFASRLLFAWPDPPPHCALADCRPARDDEALAALRRIATVARTPDDPLVLGVDERALRTFDGFLSALRAEISQAEDLEMAWLGKGRGTVARLAGVLELLAWSALGSSVPPGPLGRAVGRARGAPVVGLLPCPRPRAVRSQRARRARAAGPPRRPLAAQPRSWRGVARAGAHRSARPPRRCRRGRPGAVSPAGRRGAAAGPLHRAAARPAPQSLVGQSAAQHHALCRKYRECRKVGK